MKNAMITKLSAGQPRKEKPTVMNQLTPVSYTSPSPRD